MHHWSRVGRNGIGWQWTSNFLRVPKVTKFQEQDQEEETLLDQYQTVDRWIAWLHESGKSAGRVDVKGPVSAAGSNLVHDHLGSEFTDCFWHSFLFMGRGVPPSVDVPTRKVISLFSLEWRWSRAGGGNHGISQQDTRPSLHCTTMQICPSRNPRGKTGTCCVEAGHVSLHCVAQDVRMVQEAPQDFLHYVVNQI